jgi:hypothetical protein
VNYFSHFLLNKLLENKNYYALFCKPFFLVIIYPITIFLFVKVMCISKVFTCGMELCVCSVSSLVHVDRPACVCVCVCVCV